MITLHLRYTIDPNKLSDIRAYAEAELRPIRESGGKIVGYYLPTDFAGATNEAFGIIDFPSLAEYEVYRAKLAAHPLHKQYVEKLERSGALLSIQRSLVQRVEGRSHDRRYDTIHTRLRVRLSAERKVSTRNGRAATA